ncbi:MAG: N-acetyltransferase [Chloroflexota bacterium]
MHTRTYQGLQDLHAMLDLLSEGRKADNGTYYVHRGDLQWWLFYTDIPAETWQKDVRLWFDGHRLIGWSLLSPHERAFDVFTAPHLRGDPCEHEILTWVVDQMSALEKVQNVWIAEDDDARIDWFTQNGFAPRADGLILFKRSLSGSVAEPPLPEGFNIRSSRGEADARLRAAASHASFGSSKPFDEYWPRTLRFMQSPVYVKEHDVLITAPDERVAAFCCVWTDDLNRAGYFEPVGAHPDFHRRGLGKSLLLEGLRRLQSEGMTEACVCAESDNPAAIRLYESVGFQKVKRLLTFTKGKTS